MAAFESHFCSVFGAVEAAWGGGTGPNSRVRSPVFKSWPCCLELGDLGPTPSPLGTSLFIYDLRKATSLDFVGLSWQLS